MKNKKVRWILQNNLISENDINQFQISFDELNIEYKEVIVIPFSDELPIFPIDDEFENIYYGSTTFMNNIYKLLNKPKGLFYNHETFSMENYINKWGDFMLNSDAKIISVEDFINNDFDNDSDMFLRPDGDGKEFDGQVGNISDLKTMVSRMMQYEGNMNLHTKLVLGPSYNLKREWRNYIVNGKIVTSSRYRNNFKLSKSSTDIPEDMIKFSEDMCKIYQPHEIFAMDIAEVRHDDDSYKYYIIECGCMNSVGMYNSDIKQYIKSISEYIERENQLDFLINQSQKLNLGYE